MKSSKSSRSESLIKQHLRHSFVLVRLAAFFAFATVGTCFQIQLSLRLGTRYVRPELGKFRDESAVSNISAVLNF